MAAPLRTLAPRLTICVIPEDQGNTFSTARTAQYITTPAVTGRQTAPPISFSRTAVPKTMNPKVVGTTTSAACSRYPHAAPGAPNFRIPTTSTGRSATPCVTESAVTSFGLPTATSSGAELVNMTFKAAAIASTSIRRAVLSHFGQQHGDQVVADSS